MKRWGMLAKAREAFGEHELSTIEEWNPKTKRGEYFWAKPGTSMYHAHIIFRPGTIIVYGDVQPNLIFRQYDLDLPWLRGSIGSPEYLFQKCGVQERYDSELTKEYAIDCLLNWLDERADEEGHLDGNEEKEHDRLVKLFEYTSWDEPESAIEFFSEFDTNPYEYLAETYEAAGLTYVLAALQTFIEKLDQEETL